jgi:hypothetical protein
MKEILFFYIFGIREILNENSKINITIIHKPIHQFIDNLGVGIKKS